MWILAIYLVGVVVTIYSFWKTVSVEDTIDEKRPLVREDYFLHWLLVLFFAIIWPLTWLAALFMAVKWWFEKN